MMHGPLLLQSESTRHVALLIQAILIGQLQFLRRLAGSHPLEDRRPSAALGIAFFCHISFRDSA